MGKYMPKSKASGEVAAMELGGVLLGVRTRSRILGLQQRTTSSPHKGDDPPPDQGAGAGDFLELRSRRLEKQPLPPPGHKEKDAPNAFAGRRKEQAAALGAEEGFEAVDLEASFGYNVLEWDAMERIPGSADHSSAMHWHE